MKQFFLFTLLMNIILFLWEFHQDSVHLPILPIEPDSNQAILLLSELQKKSINEKPIQTTPIKIEPLLPKPTVDQTDKTPLQIKPAYAENKQPLFCFQVAEFNNQEAAESWIKHHKIDLDQVHYLKKTKPVISSYLVYYPAAENYAQSKKNRQLLKDKGINDLWLFRQGPLKGVISLGLFVKQTRALALQKKLLKQGLAVKVMPRYKDSIHIYLNITTNNPQFKQQLPQIDQKQVKICPDHDHLLINASKM